jgi:hypothetical protein
MTTRRQRRQETADAQDQAEQTEQDEENTEMTTPENIDAAEYDTFVKWRDGQASKKAGGKARRSALQALKKNHEPEYERLVTEFKAQGMD